MARAEEEFGVTFSVNWHPYFLDVTLESKGSSFLFSFSRVFREFFVGVS
jgi:hypothetical protein